MLSWMQKVTADEERFARVNYILGGTCQKFCVRGQNFVVN